MEQSCASKVLAPDSRDAGPAGAADPVRAFGKRHESASELRENVNAPSPQPAEPSSVPASAGQQQFSTAKDKSLTQRAALRRLNGSKTKSPAPADSASAASTQPVLVRAYTRPDDDSSTMLRSRRKTTLEPSTDLPPLSSFSFQDILKEIDQEIHPSIDAIAEIFGRSKLSLADEYSSHLPPQGELSFPASQSQNEVLEAISNARLEPVEEAPPCHGRRQSLALVGTGGGAAAQPKSNAVAATSTASVEQVSVAQHSQDVDHETETRTSLLPSVLSWLRSSNSRSEMRSRRSSVDPRAVDTLQKILGES